MSNREIVQQGLDARKNTKAAEAKAERYREIANNTRDTLFREQMSHKQARRLWLEEKTIMTGWINRQHDVIVGLRQDLADAKDREREVRRNRALTNAVKYGVIFVSLIWTRGTGWIVPWLADSLTALSLVCLLAAIYIWNRNN